MDIKDYIAYDTTSKSCLRWIKPNANRTKIGDEACAVLNNHGYYSGNLLGKQVDAHRVVYFLHHGIWSSKDNPVDHIDGDKTNNCIENLRLVTRQQNMLNRTNKNVNNKRGTPRGIFSTRSGKMSVRVSGKHIGTYSTLQEAEKARDLAIKEKYNG